MEFTFQFIKFFFFGLELAAPLLISLALLIILLGQIVGARESWDRFDSLYWSFITATTVGYGDFRPLARLSKLFAIMIALVGIIFTGIMVALAINAASISFKAVNDINELKSSIEAMQ
jgi:voltage-gated potassium channel